jgi:hypothetical protein
MFVGQVDAVKGIESLALRGHCPHGRIVCEQKNGSDAEFRAELFQAFNERFAFQASCQYE